MSSTTRTIGVPVAHVCSTQTQCKMVDVVDIYTRHRVVTEFLTADGSSLTEIQRCLRSTCGDDAIDVSSDTEPIVLRAVKMTLVTGPAAANEPQ